MRSDGTLPTKSYSILPTKCPDGTNAANFERRAESIRRNV